MPFKFQNPKVNLKHISWIDPSVTVFLICLQDDWLLALLSYFIAFFDGKVHTVQLPPVNSASFALRFLENFCQSLQCDNFLSSQPFRREAQVPTPDTGTDQSKPGKKIEILSIYIYILHI